MLSSILLGVLAFLPAAYSLLVRQLLLPTLATLALGWLVTRLSAPPGIQASAVLVWLAAAAAALLWPRIVKPAP